MDFINWIKVQLESNKLYRRIAFAYLCGLTWYVTSEAFVFAHAALEAEASDIAIAATIAAIQVPITGLNSFVAKLYWENRDIKE